MKKPITYFLAMTFHAALFAQTPFVCQGQYYMSFGQGGSTSIAEVIIDKDNGGASFDVLGNLGITLNAIGYRPLDNLIYGVDPVGFQLYRVDATPGATWLKTLPLTSGLRYLAGDVSPDGKYLVLVGGDPPGAPNTIDKQLVFVDLSDPAYPVAKVVDISSNNTRLYDIAFDPQSGNLFGFDIKGSNLVQMNPNTGALITTFPETNPRIDVGALFFNVHGNLEAYGTQSGAIHTELFSIDKTTGSVKLTANGPQSSASDGCSCPYTVDLLKEFSDESIKQCATFEMYLNITNSSQSAIAGVDLEDYLPAGFLITEILSNPFGGNVVSGVNSNLLKIEGMTIHEGTDDLVLEVYAGQVEGTFGMQAKLTGLPVSLGSTILSDDPGTYDVDDASYIEIWKGVTENIEVTRVICEGDETELTSFYNNESFQWISGATDTVIHTGIAGEYVAFRLEGCDSTILTYTVELSSVEVAIDPSFIEITPFQPFTLNPVVTTTNSTNITYDWTIYNGELNCYNCNTPVNVNTWIDDTVLLTVTNEFGCKDTAMAIIHIFEDVVIGNYFIPNAFSPDGDDLNDVFYVFGYGYWVEWFEIYDMWGQKQYEMNALPTGYPDFGWDGTNIHANDMYSNVYIYIGMIKTPEGRKEGVSGTITVVR